MLDACFALAAVPHRFNDLKELGSEAAVKAAGKYRQQGKEYVVQDGEWAGVGYSCISNRAHRSELHVRCAGAVMPKPKHLGATL